MKTLKYFLIAALSLMTCTMFTSCKDDANDWDTENGGNPTRQWAITSFSASAGDTYINFSNISVAGATGYVIQLAVTDDNFTEPTEASFASPIEKTIGRLGTEDVYKFEGLTPETGYYIRIKAISTGKADSNWVILKKDSSGSMQYGVKTKKAGEDANFDD